MSYFGAVPWCQLLGACEMLIVHSSPYANLAETAALNAHDA